MVSLQDKFSAIFNYFKDSYELHRVDVAKEFNISDKNIAWPDDVEHKFNHNPKISDQ